MKVTAIIPSLISVDREYLKLAVTSLRATTDWDIIVVTNGTKTPEPIPEINNMCKRLHTRDQGQCNAVNIGASQVSPDTDYIFISNSDMYYAPGWNKNLRFYYPVFSPNLVEPENNHGSADPFLKFPGGFTLEEFKKEEVDKFIVAKIFELETGEETGFNFPLFIRKDLWDLLGGYDTAYDPWGSNSDTDLQTRINLAGVTPMRLRDVLVYHFSNKTPTFSPENDAFRMNNFEYFKNKFGFDRDELGSDVWYNKDMIPQDETKIKLKVPKYEA
jgi:GT2 family glycosyltransferase